MPGAISGWMSCTSRRSFLFVLRSSTYTATSASPYAVKWEDLCSHLEYSYLWRVHLLSLVCWMSAGCTLQFWTCVLAMHGRGASPPPPISRFPVQERLTNKRPRAQGFKMVPIFSFFSHESSFEPPSTPLTLSASHTSVASSYLQNPNVTKSHANAINMNYLRAFGPIPFTF